MKKLLGVAMIGAVVLGAQSMIFANGVNTEKITIKKIQSAETLKDEIKNDVAVEGKATEAAVLTEAMQGEKVETGAEGIKATLTTDAMQREMTEEEKAADFAKVKEVCEALNLEYDENTVLDQVFSKLTDAQFEKLVDLGIIQVMEAAISTPAEVIQK